MNMDQRWRVVFLFHEKGSWVTIDNHTIKDNGLRLTVAVCNHELFKTIRL